MFDTSKRKNEDKAKGLPPRYKAVILALVAVSLATLIGVALRIIYTPSTGLSGHLFYISGSQNYDLNMATGERVTIDPAQKPQVPTHDWTPVSPDGQWRAEWLDGVASSNGQGTYSILRIYRTSNGQAFDVTPLELLTDGGKGVAWTPDSQSIVFSANREDMPGYSGAELWRVNIVTRELERLTVNTHADLWPTVSPDGTKIGYVATADGYRRLYVLDTATGQSQLLTPEMYVYFPVWSPDSQWLAFKTDHTGSPDIWIVRADGSEKRPIAITEEIERDPVWLP